MHLWGLPPTTFLVNSRHHHVNLLLVKFDLYNRFLVNNQHRRVNLLLVRFDLCNKFLVSNQHHRVSLLLARSDLYNRFPLLSLEYLSLHSHLKPLHPIISNMIQLPTMFLRHTHWQR
jgi:hypothetical protein